MNIREEGEPVTLQPERSERIAFHATWNRRASEIPAPSRPLHESAATPRVIVNDEMAFASRPLGDLGVDFDFNLEAIPFPSLAPYYPVSNWDRYEFLGVLGRGGMGRVYRARDRRTQRLVAIKFVSGQNERLQRLFVREAHAQSRISHPGICKVSVGCRDSDGMA